MKVMPVTLFIEHFYLDVHGGVMGWSQLAHISGPSL
jgi:hypothetical protein